MLYCKAVKDTDKSDQQAGSNDKLIHSKGQEATFESEYPQPYRDKQCGVVKNLEVFKVEADFDSGYS